MSGVLSGCRINRFRSFELSRQISVCVCVCVCARAESHAWCSSLGNNNIVSVKSNDELQIPKILSLRAIPTDGCPGSDRLSFNVRQNIDATTRDSRINVQTRTLSGGRNSSRHVVTGCKLGCTYVG